MRHSRSQLLQNRLTGIDEWVERGREAVDEDVPVTRVGILRQGRGGEDRDDFADVVIDLDDVLEAFLAAVAFVFTEPTGILLGLLEAILRS